MRDDYAIAADLCEEHGLVAPAGVLRQIAAGVGEVFMVRLNEFDFRDGLIAGPLAESSHRTRRLFSTRDMAEAYAAQLKAFLLREYRYQPWMEPYLFTVSATEFCRHVATVLGIDYRLPEGDGGPLVPAWTSDEQVRAIAPLFKDEIVEVERIPLNPAEEA